MHILIAPNSFKNSLDATACAEAIEQGFLQSKLNCTCTCFPVGDGGDGTAFLLNKKLQATIIKVDVHDPLRRMIQSSFGFVEDDKTAIIEMADASGLKLLKRDELQPLKTTSAGTGELIKAALNKNAQRIILCIGGSATVDGGTGILQALGFTFLNTDNVEIDLPNGLENLYRVDISKVDKRIYDCEILVLCDVENVLSGDNGAAKIFGPQKGANEDDIAKLERCLQQFQLVTQQQKDIDISNIKHGGAAGGAAAGCYAWLNANLVNGIDYFLQLTNFNDALKSADILITGEGSIDEQTLQGKAPFGVAVRAKEKNIPVIGLAGKVPLVTSEMLNKYFDVLISINNEADFHQSVLHTEQNLQRTAEAVGNLLSVKLV